MMRSVIRGTGGYLPERIMTNEEMSTIVEPLINGSKTEPVFDNATSRLMES